MSEETPQAPVADDADVRVMSSSGNSDQELGSVDSSNGGAELDAGADVSDDGQGLTPEQEVDSLREKLVRTVAEFQNYRKRVEQNRALEAFVGKAAVVGRMLNVLDDLERSVAAADDLKRPTETDVAAEHEAFLQGIHLVHKKFQDELKALGLVAIQSVGKPFDEKLHDALMEQPAAEGQEPSTVVAEIEKGYLLGDRVLRHAKVIVAK